MRGVELFMGCFVIACAISEFEAPAALAQQRNWVPAQLSYSCRGASCSQTPSKRFLMNITLDVAVFPAPVMVDARATNFAGPWCQVMGSATAVVPPVRLERLGLADSRGLS